MSLNIVNLKHIHDGAIKYYRIIKNLGGKKPLQIWQLMINAPKFYLPPFLIHLDFFCINTQSINDFSTKTILGACGC